ncbi:hypothetical protein lbkm_4260 [Lachnospiraceae bacterium KM106-2]|nr:hypothetical protein lbkm_4260 [Lachnospiraceae bacterium KM106-2]
MGKLIRCTGVMAQNPYKFMMTGVSVYSIEEMSYYIYNNIYAIEENLLDENFIAWVRDEIHMKPLADKLFTLYQNKNNLKDIVVTILCSNDYYSEKEVKEIILIMDEIINLPYIKRQKMKADNFLKYGQYSKAAAEYTSIVKSKDIGKFTKEEYGNILHNLGVTWVRIKTYEEAQDKFKEAYTLNHNTQSLYAYLMAVKLSGNEELLNEEILRYELSEETSMELEKDIDEKYRNARREDEYLELEHLENERQRGKSERFDENVKRIITKWKDEYRHFVEN